MSIVVSVLEMFANPTADEQWCFVVVVVNLVFLVVSVLEVLAD